MRYALALIAALIPLPSEAENPIPEGDYVFVDEILKTSVEAGLIVPVYILVKSREDQLRVAFMTTFSPGTRDCSDYGKCDRTVEAIELDVEETEGRLAVTDSRTLSDATIDRQETDKSLIVAPTQIFIDGAAVSVGNDPSIPRVVTLTKKDARVARLIPASRDFVESAVDFARTTDLALSRLDKCLIRQIATMSARHDRSPAATKLLAAVAHAGRTARLERQTRANDNVPEEGSQEWRDRLVAQMLRIASNPYGGDPKTPREALEAVVGTGLANKLGDEYELILEAAFAGHEAEVMAARRWAAAYKSARESHGSDAALGKRLCDDITLSE